MKIFLFKSLIVFILTYSLFQITFFSQIDKIKQNIEYLSEKETRENFKNKLLSEINEANNKEFYFSTEEKVILSKFIKKILKELDLQ